MPSDNGEKSVLLGYDFDQFPGHGLSNSEALPFGNFVRLALSSTDALTIPQGKIEELTYSFECTQKARSDLTFGPLEWVVGPEYEHVDGVARRNFGWFVEAVPKSREL